MNIIRRFLAEEGGQGLVEYALIVGLIALACVVAIGAAGGALSSWWSTLEECIENAPGLQPGQDC